MGVTEFQKLSQWQNRKNIMTLCQCTVCSKNLVLQLQMRKVRFFKFAVNFYEIQHAHTFYEQKPPGMSNPAILPPVVSANTRTLACTRLYLDPSCLASIGGWFNAWLVTDSIQCVLRHYCIASDLSVEDWWPTLRSFLNLANQIIINLAVFKVHETWRFFWPQSPKIC